MNDNEVYMYAWDETVASKHIIAYNDRTGPNSNIKLAVTWLKIMQSAENNTDIIDHKFYYQIIVIL